MGTYRIDYELESEELTELVREHSATAKPVVESYHRIVIAESVWQALVVLGTSLACDNSLSCGEDDQGTAYAGSFTIKAVTPCRWSGAVGDFIVGYDEKLHWKKSNSFTITDSVSGNALAGLNLPGTSE